MLHLAFMLMYVLLKMDSRVGAQLLLVDLQSQGMQFTREICERRQCLQSERQLRMLAENTPAKRTRSA